MVVVAGHVQQAPYFAAVVAAVVQVPAPDQPHGEGHHQAKAGDRAIRRQPPHGAQAIEQAQTQDVPEVTALVLEAQTVPYPMEYVGQTAGSREVQVRARVNGILQQKNYVEGSIVKENDLLFTIEPDTYQAVYDDAKASLASSAAGQVLRVNTGHSQRWPGVTLKAPAEMWNLSAFDELALDLSNPGARPVTVSCRVDNTGANGTDHCVTGSLTVEPGRSGTLAVRLRRAADSTLD